MEKIKIGYAFCGSFCTIKESLAALRRLAQMDYNIMPIMSSIVYSTDTRFGYLNDSATNVKYTRLP